MSTGASRLLLTDTLGVAYLIDSDVVIDYLNRRDYARKLLSRLQHEGLVALSTVTHLEIYQGMRVGEERETNEFLDHLPAIPPGIAIARRAGNQLRDLSAEGITIDVADSIIGATAIEIGVPLVTNNVAHYRYLPVRTIRALWR